MTETKKAGQASSIRKVFSILDLFSVARPSLSADEIIAALGCSRPQGYRYIRDLCQTGFLVRTASAYRLGARAIEIDYIVRRSDPLLHAATPTMREISEQNGCDVMLVSLVGDRIITIHHESGVDPMAVTYRRGRVLPRFRGAGSKAIVAAMPLAQQRAFFAAHIADEPESAIGVTWASARPILKDIRKQGVATSIGELDPANVGVSAPISLDTPGTQASIVVVMSAARYRIAEPEAVAQLIKLAAARVSQTLQQVPLPQLG